jgi:hypothetical protein
VNKATLNVYNLCPAVDSRWINKVKSRHILWRAWGLPGITGGKSDAICGYSPLETVDNCQKVVDNSRKLWITFNESGDNVFSKVENKARDVDNSSIICGKVDPFGG